MEHALRQAGWFEGREVDVEDWRRQLAQQGGFRMHPHAETFLREFGGLTIEVRGAGQDFARSPFDVHPQLAAGEDDRLGAFASKVEEVEGSLFPLGEIDHGHEFLTMDEAGGFWSVMDEIRWLGSTPEEAIIGLVEGIRRERS